MSSAEDTLTILERIRDLENQLADQWRLLGREETSQFAQELQLLEIVVDDRVFALAVESLREVIGMVWPHPLPDAPEWLRGTFVFEGQTVPLVDLRTRITGTQRPMAAEDRVVIVDHPRWLGLVVDSVGQVVTAHSSQLTSPGAELPHANFMIAELPQGDGRSIQLLSPQRLMREFDD